jgi:hypothetical protein
VSTAIALVDGVYQRGFVNTPGDADYFGVELLAGATYEIMVIGDSDLSLIGGSGDDIYTKLRILG